MRIVSILSLIFFSLEVMSAFRTLDWPKDLGLSTMCIEKRYCTQELLFRKIKKMEIKFDLQVF